jgi:hypothetical protein
VAFKAKIPKWLAKGLAGAGIVALGGLVLNRFAPDVMQSAFGKVALPVASYAVGGAEAAVGAVVTEVVGNNITSFSGPNAEGNVQVESL